MPLVEHLVRLADLVADAHVGHALGGRVRAPAAGGGDVGEEAGGVGVAIV